jgi:hypothetical protein
LALIKQKELTAERKQLEVFANQDWQDSGVTLLAGKTVVIQAAGNWNFKMSHQLGPEGMEIPKELRDFNLGSLIGIVAAGDPKDAKPFYIGTGLEHTAEQTGRLFLRMYDSDTTDNVGKISVEIQGTFDRK